MYKPMRMSIQTKTFFGKFCYLWISKLCLKKVWRDIFGLYTFIIFICWYINCLLYVNSFFFNIKYEHNITLKPLYLKHVYYQHFKKSVYGLFMHVWFKGRQTDFYFIYFLSFYFCRFCLVIRYFHPCHNSQWPPTSKDFLSQILSITFIFLS